MANINNYGNGNAGGSIQVPVGYRFRPTDEELLLHYLKRKVYSLPLPASVIPEHFHLFRSHPSHLPGDSKEKRYFFCKRKWNHVKKCRITRTCDGSGYWKAIGKDKAINVTAAAASAIGTKKSFVFYQGTRPHALKTQWFMVEYRLLPSQTTTNSTQELEDWVVRCIYQRKRKARNHGISNKTRRNMEEEVITASCDGMNMMDFMIFDITDQFGPPLPSPTCSSGNIRFSNNELLDQEEECSSNSFGPYFSCF